MSTPDAPLGGRRCLVTGASSGIGRATAMVLAARGADLWLVGRRQGELDATAAMAAQHGVTARVRATDLADDPDRAGLAEEIAGEPPDVVVHSAGIMRLGTIEETTVADLDSHYASNLRAAYALTRALLPALRSSGGDVVFINSSIAMHPRGGTGQYAAMEAGLRAIADSLRDEVNADGVRVLSVYPGRTATPRQEELHGAEGREYRPERLLQPEDVGAAVVAALELPRTAEITDLHIRPFLKPL